MSAPYSRIEPGTWSAPWLLIEPISRTAPTTRIETLIQREPFKRIETGPRRAPKQVDRAVPPGSAPLQEIEPAPTESTVVDDRADFSEGAVLVNRACDPPAHRST